MGVGRFVGRIWNISQSKDKHEIPGDQWNPGLKHCHKFSHFPLARVSLTLLDISGTWLSLMSHSISDRRC